MIDFKKFFRQNIETVDPVDSLSRAERTDLATQISRVNIYLLAGLVFVLPLLFVPSQADWFDLPKSTLLLLAGLVSVTLWFVRSVLTKKLYFVRSVFFFPVLILAVTSIISALLSVNRYMALESDTIVYVGCLLLVVLISQVVDKEKTINIFLKSLLFSAVAVALFTFLQTAVTLVPALKTLGNNIYLNPNFSPVGSPLSLGLFLCLVLPIAIGHYLHNRKVLNMILAVIVTAGVAVSLFNVYRQKPVLLPHTVGWKIATATLGDSPQSAFLGVAPSNFVDAFTANKSLDFNTTPYWNLRFTTSSNLYFYLLTTTGIAGLVGFLILVARLIKLAQKRLQNGIAKPLEKGLIISLLLGLVLFALLPTPSVILMVFFVILGILIGLYRIYENNAYVGVPMDVAAENAWFRPGGAILSLAILGFVGYYLASFLMADYYFALSIFAAQNNRGTDTYNYQIKALEKNQWNDGYHVSYSQTNLALADALAGQPNLSDQQKQTVVSLVQQAIREGRIAVTLAPKRASDWENLSIIYRGLINFAQGADQWAVVAQNQAIVLDPANPRLRLDLGGVYYSRKDFQNAGQQFATAVNLKNDYANAHYNFAQALKQLGLKDQATQQLQQTATLVCDAGPASPAGGQTADCQRINEEIKSLGAAAPAPANPTAEVKLATPAAQPNLPKAATKPPAKISSPAGELTP